MNEPLRLENTAEGRGVDGETYDVVKEYARATVDRIVRRGCLNLANRPWRLAGVRWGSSRSLFAPGLGCGWRRLRMFHARRRKPETHYNARTVRLHIYIFICRIIPQPQCNLTRD